MLDKQKNIWVRVLTDLDAPFWLINKAMHRMAAGTDKYGDFNAKTDKRNLLIEIEKELLDAVNYTLMEFEGEDRNNGLLDDLISLTIRVRNLRDKR